MSYSSPNVSTPIVEPCSDDNATQRWNASETGGDGRGHHTHVKIEAVDGRCLCPAAVPHKHFCHHHSLLHTS